MDNNPILNKIEQGRVIAILRGDFAGRETAMNANDISKASDELSKADADVADGKYDNAIGRYLSAWKNALKAVKG